MTKLQLQKEIKNVKKLIRECEWCSGKNSVPKSLYEELSKLERIETVNHIKTFDRGTQKKWQEINGSYKDYIKGSSNI